MGDQPGLGRGRRRAARPAATYFARQVFGCFFSDRFGLENLVDIGEDNVMFECDYPHSDSTWPDTLDVAREMCFGLDPVVVEKIMRGNAIELFGLRDRLRLPHPVGA